MKALFVGSGAISRRHAQNFRELEPAAASAILSRSRPDWAAPESAWLPGLPEALAWGPQLAVIANPAPLHLPVALALLDAGVSAVLIEKPISGSVEGVEALLRKAAEKHVPLLVGYNLRYDPALVALKSTLERGAIGVPVHLRLECGQYLPDWRPTVDYRQSVSARRALGGGVLLELSHEIDMALWLGGSARCRAAILRHVSGLDLDVEDFALLQLHYESGADATLQMDFIQRPGGRFYKLLGTEGTATWSSLHPDYLELANLDREAARLDVPAAADRNASYRELMRHFLACARGEEVPRHSAAGALDTLAIVAQARALAAPTEP